MNRTQRQLIVLIAVFISTWLIFSYISENYFDNRDTKTIISIDSEEKLASAIHSIILSEYDTINLPLTNIALDSILMRLQKGIDSARYKYRFTVINSNQLNAFATLGGRIYIFKGLIEQSDNAEMLASVLAHEIGHIEHHDFEKRLVKNMAISTVVAVATGGNENLISELSKSLIGSSYDRQQEAYADNFALELLEKVNIDPSSLGVFFIKIKRLNNSNFDLEYFQSHPNTSSRIEDVVNYHTEDDFNEIKFDSLQWLNVINEVNKGTIIQ